MEKSGVLRFPSLPMEGSPVSDLYLLSERLLVLIRTYFPLAQGVSRVDDGRVLGGLTRSFI